MRERSPDVWELIVQAGQDPVTGRYRQVTRTFYGGLRGAKEARAELLAEVKKGRHSGTNATVDDLCAEWLIELRRKDRSPNTIKGYERVYRHDIQQTLGKVRVRQVTTKMLTDLYGEHQRRGLAPSSVHKIHATISSMMGQACRWGWRDSNPAEWAEPPPLGDVVPEVPTPDEVLLLAKAASGSRRPVYGKVIFLAAIAGARRGEICALRAKRDVNWEAGLLTIAHNIVRDESGELVERPTKNRRRRSLALDDRTLSMLRAQCHDVEDRAVAIGVEIADDPFIFTDAEDGSDPWDPDAISQYFTRLRDRTGLQTVQFKALRRFMDTYGQELGFSLAQVAVRAGHDPAVASKHYTGRVAESDRELSAAIAELLTGR